MSMISFDGRRFFYTGADGKAIILLDAHDVYGNHSAVSMVQQMDASYGQTRQDKPFWGTLMKNLEPLKEQKRLGYILVLLLIMRQLWKKPRPIKVLRVGGSASDAFSEALTNILRAFHQDSLLCCMESGSNAASAPGVLVLPLDMKGGRLMQGQFSVILLDDMQGEMRPELVVNLLPLLEPWGRFFCLTDKSELLVTCQNLLSEARTLQAEGSLSLLTQVCTGKDLARVFRLTPEGKLIRAKKEIKQRLESLLIEIESLEYLDGKEVERMMCSAKELESSLCEIYPSLVSVDVKRLATQLREAMIEWRLGNAKVQRVRECLLALWEDWQRYEETGL